MPTLHIFNPETEFALGHGGEYYTPPASIVDLRKRLALLPAVYASPGDYILMMDRAMSPADPDHQKLIKRKKLTVLPHKTDLSKLPQDVAVEPWGWNLSLRQWLIDNGMDPERLPSPEWIATLRELAHRHVTITFLRRCGIPSPLLPREMFTIFMATDWCRSHRNAYVKAPWSSSGRGIYRALDPDARDLQQWINGTIRRQESVMVEPAWDRVLDFATEWRLSDGEAHFLGFSLFNVDDHYQYTGNVSASQEEIERILDSKFNDNWTRELLVARQKDALEAMIAPHYSGLLGVDCLVDSQGDVNPCVEINLRRTMGMIGLMK